MTQEEFSEKFMLHLNKQQREATQTVDGAILLLAVPGSGKTTVLLTRLGYMVFCRGIDPSSILTMTYTVAATKEMKQRFSYMFGSEYADALEFRTINGLSAKIIDYYGRNHGKRQPFELLDNDADLTRIVGQIFQKVNREYATESTIKDIRTCITYIKNMMLTKEEIEALDIGVPQISEIYNQYCAELKRRGQMDYDDQMSYALTILNAFPTVLEHFQEQFRYICVDESQDTSKIQHVIIRLLAQKYGNIFMVGDEDQSIYGFRAAYPDALINFSNEYPNAKVLLIEHNYRSTNNIVAVANAFVSRNRFRYKKSIVPTRGNGLPIQVIDVVNRATQYKYLLAVARNCEIETAVLFRNNDSALPLIDMLERNGIPYNCRQFDGGVFFSHRVVVDITDIINFAYDPCDAEDFMRVYYKLGSPLTKKAAMYACEQSKRTGRPILEELIKFTELSSYAKEGVIKLMTLLPMILKADGKKAVRLIWDMAGYGQYAISNRLDAGKIETLCMLGENEASPRDLLRRLNEMRNIIQNHVNINSSSTRFVLSTIHSSKGLEYDRVFMLDIFDGTLPSNPVPDVSSRNEIKQYEEDRRLYYVGMTRAKNVLCLFKCRNIDSAFTMEVLRSLPSKVIDSDSVMSIFKQDLCDRTYMHKDEGKGTIIAQCGYTVLVEYKNSSLQLLTVLQLFEQRDLTVKYEPSSNNKPQKTQDRPEKKVKILSVQETESIISRVTVGRIVTHNKFGRGVVTKTDGAYVSIRFDGAVEEKKFDLVVAVQNGIIQI